MNASVGIDGDYGFSERGDGGVATELIWRPAAICNTLDGLAGSRLDGGAWHEDFLTIGHRLRVTYGNTLTVDEDAPAYLVTCGRTVTVSVTCPVDTGRAELVRMRALALNSVALLPQLSRSLLLTNARLALARASLIGDSVWVEYELPFCAAHAPALAAGVSAVGRGVRRVCEGVGAS